MPYTTPLGAMPSFPAAHSPLVDKTGRPTPEYLTFLRELEAYMRRERAALDEVEP